MEIRVLIHLLMSILLLMSSSSCCSMAAALTFSTKLIHRFSDEVKDFRVSRNGGDSSVDWPKVKSLDYYQLLVKSDLEKQKMKIGSQHQFLLPAQGSKTMSYGNDFGWLHYTWIDVGTPNVSFLVALDAGSDLLWVPCDCIQCAPLSASHYNSLDRDLSEYNPSGSSTSNHLSCSHELCELGSNCNSPKQPCPYIATYNSENTSSSGFLVEDTLHMVSSSAHASKKLVQASVIIGCGRKQSGGYLDGVAPDGLLGLGLGDISVPSFLAKAGLMRNSFSMCFNEDDSGRILFGDKGVTGEQSTKLLPLDEKYVTYMVGVEGFCIGSTCLKQTGFQAQIDSGTSFTFLPVNVYEKVVAEFDKRVKAKRSSYGGSPWEYCYETSSLELNKIPSLTLTFPLDNRFLVHNPSFYIYGDEGVTAFCLAIQPAKGDFGTIGQNFMTGYRIVFDREMLKLSWSLSNCNDLLNDTSESQAPLRQDTPENPLPTNEQQSAPGGRAVAPAVAGRAPSRPSAASQQVVFRGSHLLCYLLHLLQLTVATMLLQ